MDEGKRVAAAAGVELREDPWEMNVLATQRGSAHVPSMLEDVERKRRTEIDMITGALVREGRRPRRPGAAARDDGAARQGEGGLVLVRRRLDGAVKGAKVPALPAPKRMQVCIVGCGAGRVALCSEPRDA